MNQIPDAPSYSVTAQLRRAWTLVHITSCVDPVRVLEKGISSDPQHLSC